MFLSETSRFEVSRFEVPKTSRFLTVIWGSLTQGGNMAGPSLWEEKVVAWFRHYEPPKLDHTAVLAFSS